MKIYLDYLKSCKVLDSHPKGYIDLDEISTGSVDAKIKYIESNYLSKNARIATIDGKYQVVPSGKLATGYVTVAFKSKDDDKTKLKMTIKLNKVTEHTMYGPVSEIDAIHAYVSLKTPSEKFETDFVNIDLGDLICDDIRNWVYDHGYTEYNSVIDFIITLTDKVANSDTFRVGIDPIDPEECEATRIMNSEALKCTIIRYLTTTFKCGILNASIVADETDIDEDTGMLKKYMGNGVAFGEDPKIPDDMEGNVISIEERLDNEAIEVPEISKVELIIDDNILPAFSTNIDIRLKDAIEMELDIRYSDSLLRRNIKFNKELSQVSISDNSDTTRINIKLDPDEYLELTEQCKDRLLSIFNTGSISNVPVPEHVMITAQNLVINDVLSFNVSRRDDHFIYSSYNNKGEILRKSGTDGLSYLMAALFVNKLPVIKTD